MSILAHKHGREEGEGVGGPGSLLGSAESRMIYSSRHFLTCEVHRRRNLHSSRTRLFSLSLSLFVRSFIFFLSPRFVSQIRFLCFELRNLRISLLSSEKGSISVVGFTVESKRKEKSRGRVILIFKI